MKMNKFALVVVFTVITILTTFAEDEYYKPFKNEVVLVYSCRVSPKIDKDFFLSYVGKRSRFIDVADENSNSGNEIINSKVDFIALNYRYPDISQKNITAISENEVIISVNVEIPENRKIIIDSFNYRIGGSEIFSILLPVVSEITVPKGVNYIYLGDFNYRLQGYFLNVESFEIKDSMEKAQSVIKKRYGDDANLVRGILKPIN